MRADRRGNVNVGQEAVLDRDATLTHTR